MTRSMAARLALMAAPALVLVACSSGAEPAADTASMSESASASASATESPSDSASASPQDPETILAVLCDAAEPESVKAIEAVLDPEFKISQLVDVRTDDRGTHAILGFVEGPGLAVLAQWTGTGLGLTGLAAADDFAAQVTDVPRATLDKETEDLLSQTVPCYTSVYASEDGDDKKKNDGSAE
jgi:hypothetical protein